MSEETDPGDEHGRPEQYAIEDATCAYCGVAGQIRVEWRKELRARPLGSHSLSGSQLKLSALELDWPWAVCHNCGHESRGREAS